MINYDTRRGGINVTTETGPTQTLSNLVISDARHQDSGNYTCSASNTQSASSNVFVSHGKMRGWREVRVDVERVNMSVCGGGRVCVCVVGIQRLD